MVAGGYHGVTPYRVIAQHRKMSVLRFCGSARCFAKPVLCIPALISRSYILDLYQGGSLVAALAGAGHDVYLLDWGVIGDEDAGLGLQEVAIDYISRAIAAVQKVSGCAQRTLLGYCMGGTLATLWSAACGGAKRDNLIALAAPFDFQTAGLLAHWCREKYLDIERITDVFGNVPAHIVETVFTLLRPTARFRAALAFSRNYNEEPARQAFTAMDRWVNDWVPFPGAAARDWIQWFYQRNGLAERSIALNGRAVDVGKIRSAVCVVAALGDAIVPAESSRPLRYAVASKDVTYFEVGGGHIGMVAGRASSGDLFPKLLAWLETRST
ncbi:MAG: hypothetical protein DLM50_05520 [Candidatus Meridianibacter frigidus]|nr:MAG: hypothetical protein DLM50_05520 [Candidatus Eremiobacteraeota bacterium]